VALNSSYPWQSETNIYLPGGATSVAHQFLRCVLHQLAPNGIFVQMFQTHADGKTHIKHFLIFIVTPCMLLNYSIIIPTKTKLCGLSPHANYTDRVAAAGQRS